MSLSRVLLKGCGFFPLDRGLDVVPESLGWILCGEELARSLGDGLKVGEKGAAKHTGLKVRVVRQTLSGSYDIR